LRSSPRAISARCSWVPGEGRSGMHDLPLKLRESPAQELSLGARNPWRTWPYPWPAEARAQLGFTPSPRSGRLVVAGCSWFKGDAGGWVLGEAVLGDAGAAWVA